MKPKILFISHSATRTGAPIVLLNFIRWFKQNVDWHFDIMLPTAGDLLPDFSALGPTHILDQIPWGQRKIGRRILRKLGVMSNEAELFDKAVRERFSSPPLSLIFSSTVVNLRELTIFAPLNIPVLCHAHELETVFAQAYPNGSGPFLKRVTRFIAVSNAVRTGLIQTQGVSPEIIDVVREFIPVPDVQSTPGRDYRKEVRAELGLPPDALIVGGVGTIGWRKGTDLFLQLCAHVRQLAPQLNIYFVWIGNKPDQAYVEMMYDLARMPEKNRVIVTGIKSDCRPYFEAFDVFTLTSREDPFPLVCLEAAAAGKPVLCFNQAGGMPEFVEDDIGFVVPYMDVGTMADRIVQLLSVPNLAMRLGNNARKKVRERNDVSVAAPKIFQVMQKMIEPPI